MYLIVWHNNMRCLIGLKGMSNMDKIAKPNDKLCLEDVTDTIIFIVDSGLHIQYGFSYVNYMR